MKRTALTKEINYTSLFAGLPGLYLILKPDSPKFTIVDASDAYLNATMTKREIIIGHGLFEIFPDNPNDPNALFKNTTYNVPIRWVAVLRHGTGAL
jgi:hypothetical protein